MIPTRRSEGPAGTIGVELSRQATDKGAYHSPDVEFLYDVGDPHPVGVDSLRDSLITRNDCDKGTY